MENWQQILADLQLAEEVGTEVAADLSALEAGQACSGSFTATLFGHKQSVTISFSPIAS